MTDRSPPIPTRPTTPPRFYSAPAERALLAALLLDADQCWAENVTGIIQPGDFFLDECRFTYRAVLWLRERNTPVTVPTVAWALEQLSLIAQVDELTDGAESWLLGLVAEWYTAHGASAHARIIADYARRRGLLREAESMAQEAFRPNKHGAGWIEV